MASDSTILCIAEVSSKKSITTFKRVPGCVISTCLRSAVWSAMAWLKSSKAFNPFISDYKSMLLQPFLELRFQCALLVNTHENLSTHFALYRSEACNRCAICSSNLLIWLFSMLSPFPTVLSRDRRLPDNFLNINNTSSKCLDCNAFQNLDLVGKTCWVESQSAKVPINLHIYT